MEEEEKPKSTATIGANGGTIGTDDISILIPAGSFSEDYEIAIYDEPDDGAFGENTVSNSYKIAGIPNNFTKPIKFKMKYSGELSEQSFLAVGTKTYDTIFEDSSIVYSLYSASDSSGFLISELPENDDIALPKLSGTYNASNIKDEIFINLASGYKSRVTQNFTIQYPSSVEQYVDFVDEIFESSLGIVRNDMGVNFFPNDTKGFVVLKVQETPIERKYELSQLVLSLFNVSIGAAITDVVSNGELRRQTGNIFT